MSKDQFSTLSDHVYDTLLTEITEGVLEPGQRLVRRPLGRRLGVSAIPVAEALYRLEQDGLVESAPMHGARVRALTIENVRNDHILREALECQSARLCAEKATDRQLQDLSELAVEVDTLLATAEPQPKRAHEQHLEFHLGIARASGCAVLERELRRIWFRRLMQINTVQELYAPVNTNRHQELTRALTLRDPERAETAMRQHVRYRVDEQLASLERLIARQKGSRPGPK